MQLVTKAIPLAAVAILPILMLMDTAAAVEVTSAATPILPEPDRSAVPAAEAIVPKATPPSPNCHILGARSFSIPFTVDATGTQPVEVHLFVSRGESGAWKLLDRQRPNVAVRQFQFNAEEDGEYWFATRTIDSQGNPHPSGRIQPQLKVYVDTTKPNVVLEVDADASGRVDAVLAIDDATPVKNMRLRYVTDTVTQWRNVDVNQLSSDGRLQFTPSDAWQQLSIQFVAIDTPGNQSVVTHLVRRPRMANSLESRFAATPSKDSVEARSLPYRIKPDDPAALAVNSPVIKLDRRRPQQPNNNLSTAHGYSANTGSQVLPFGGFRGAAAPAPRRPVGTGPTMPQLAPAPASTLAPAPSSRSNRMIITGIPPHSAPAQGSAPTQAQPPQNVSPPSRAVGQTPSIASQRPQASPPVPTSPNVSPRNSRGGPQLPSRRPNQAGSAAMLTRKADPSESASLDLNSPQQATPQQKTPQTAPAPTAIQTQPRREARTPAEAMRPLSEPSAVPEPRIEPAPKSQPDPNAARYEALRSAARDTSVVRAPVRHSDSERFSLEYELEAVGVQGVEAIELYGSVDRGQSWDLWGQDPDRVSPFDIEVKEEGVFGFRIVVVGSNGLASPRPMAGESPDIVVVVDKTTPVVRITGAQYGQGNRVGSLVIQYECQDNYLVQRPIALSFSDSPEGPWTTIAAGLRNDGDYVWPADPQLPRQLFLRIDATDQAGNVGTYVLDQPIDAQGLAPRARIRGFQSLSGNLPDLGDEPTAKRPRAAFK